MNFRLRINPNNHRRIHCLKSRGTTDQSVVPPQLICSFNALRSSIRCHLLDTLDKRMQMNCAVRWRCLDASVALGQSRSPEAAFRLCEQYPSLISKARAIGQTASEK